MTKTISSRARALKIAEFTLEKKAADVIILDVRAMSSIGDYFVIVSGGSTRQVKAIYENVARKCKKNRIKIHHYEGNHDADWILVDFFDVILHIFFNETREVYDLENLWKNAKKISTKKLIAAK